MAEYTAQEYTDMIIMYGVAGENARAAARLYAERFPERERHPSFNVILRCIHPVRETGSLLLNRRNANAPMHYRADVEERILQVFEENPGTSVRGAARMLSLSRNTVHRTLRQNGLHPYHYQRVRQLLVGDHEQRIYFCEGIFIIFIYYWCYL